MILTLDAARARNGRRFWVEPDCYNCNEFKMRSFPILELLQDSDDPCLTPERLKFLERELDVSFSSEYAEFLLQFNGGDFRRHVMFYVPNARRWPAGIRVATFLGDPGDRVNFHGIAWYAETFSERIPDDYLVIADCGGLDLILMTVAAERPNFGNVWFWDGTEEGEGDNIHWVADSFNEFLSLLQYDTYYDDEELESIPIFKAIEQSKLKTVEDFIAQGGNIETRNADGQTLLAAAVRHSWPKIVRRLLALSANPNARDHLGRGPLHHAASSSIDSVKLLLAAGADPKARDAEGKSVLAQWSYRADQILRAHGAED